MNAFGNFNAAIGGVPLPPVCPSCGTMNMLEPLPFGRYRCEACSKEFNPPTKR